MSTENNYLHFLSNDRLEPYLNITNGCEAKSVELHNHVLRIGNSLFSFITLFEICLRNQADYYLSERFGSEWIETNIDGRLKDKEKNHLSTAQNKAKQAKYHRLLYKDKKQLEGQIFPNGKPDNLSDSQVAKQKILSLGVDKGHIIAQTTLFFWKRLFAREYENELWKSSLRKIFPDKSLKRSDVADKIEVLYFARNRIAHHEPIYGRDLEKVISSIEFIRDHMGQKPRDRNPFFMDFTAVAYHRLQIDYIDLKRNWEILTV